MTRESLRKHCEQMMKMCERVSESGTYQEHKMIIDLLNKTEWIPVTKRLPEKEGLYLVSVKNEHNRRYSKTCWYSDKNWFARQDVIAWMPLPQPYVAESENT